MARRVRLRDWGHLPPNHDARAPNAKASLISRSRFPWGAGVSKGTGDKTGLLVMAFLPVLFGFLLNSVLFSVTPGGASPEGKEISWQDPGLPRGVPVVILGEPASMSAMASMGARHYGVACLNCHGPLGAGRRGIAPSLTGSSHRQSPLGEATIRSVLQGAPHSGEDMESANRLSDLPSNQIDEIIAFLQSVRTFNGLH